MPRPQIKVTVETNVHGLKLALSNKPPCGALFWCFAFLFSFCGLAYTFSGSIRTYLSYPVVVITTVSTTEMPFPTITVCNTNPYKTSMLHRSITMLNLFSAYNILTNTSIPRSKRSIPEINNKVYGTESEFLQQVEHEGTENESEIVAVRDKRQASSTTAVVATTTVSAINCNAGVSFNGTVTYSPTQTLSGEYSSGTVATLTCPMLQYISTLGKTGSSTCLPDGTWSTVPTCIPGCLPFACFENGAVSCSQVVSAVSVIGSTATFSCNIGYYLSTITLSFTTSCLANPKWDFVPYCMRVCDQNIRIPYADPPVFSLGAPMNGGYPVGINATFTCWTGQTLVGTSAVCLGNGTWGNIPQCIGAMQSDPGCDPQMTFPSGGAVNYSTTVVGYAKYQAGVTANLICGTGFYRSIMSNITCGSNNHWEYVPECLRGCQDGGTCFMFGGVTYTPPILMDGMHPQGVIVTYFCVTGFYLNLLIESTNATCELSGYWTSQPACIAGCFNETLVNGQVYYGQMRVVNNVKQQTEIATYTCNAGYYLDSLELNSTVVCTGVGFSAFWLPVITCLIGCHNITLDNGTVVLPPSTLNGVYVQFTSITTFFCLAGFYLSTLSISTTAFCDPTGNWNGVPTCLLGCIEMPPVTNGVTTYSLATVNNLYPQTTVATFTCNSGYYLSTNTSVSTTVCSPFGQFWNFTQTPICLPGCAPVVLPNGDVTYSPTTIVNGVYAAGTVATFYCPGGSIASENTSYVATCLTSMSWTSIPVCRNATSCPPYLDPPFGSVTNGFVNISGTVRGPLAGTIVIVSCLPGYGLNGTGMSTCRNDSTWSSTDTICFPLLPFNITLHSVNELLQYLNTTVTNDFLSLTSGFQDFLPYLLSNLPDSNRSYLSYSKADMFVACFYNNQPCDMASDVTLLVDESYGNCYSFNTGHSRSIAITNRAGTKQGVSMILDAMQGEYPDWMNAVGMKIIVHNANDTVLPDSMGYDLSPGYHTVLTVKKGASEKLDRPNEKCFATSNQTNYFYYTDDYVPEGCMRSFVQSAILKLCSCGYVKYGMPQDNTTLCGPDQRTCINNYLASSEGQLAVSNATQYCNTQCAQKEFDATISMSRMSPNSRIRCDTTVKPSCQQGSIMNNLVYVQIYMDTMTVIKLTENVAYGIGNVVSDTGGQMGIWLGMSVVSFFEFATLAFAGLKKLLCHVKKH